MLIVIEIYNLRQEKNVLLSADFGIVGAFDRDGTLEEIKECVYNNTDVCQKAKKDLQKYGRLYALNVTEDKILDYVCVFLYNEEEDEFFIDSMESDDRVITSVALCG